MRDKIVIFYAAHARKDLSKLEKHLAKKIVLKIRQFAESSDPLRMAQPPPGIGSGLYRYRIGDYRAIFEIDNGGNISILTVLHVQHRKDVYR